MITALLPKALAASDAAQRLDDELVTANQTLLALAEASRNASTLANISARLSSLGSVVDNSARLDPWSAGYIPLFSWSGPAGQYQKVQNQAVGDVFLQLPSTGVWLVSATIFLNTDLSTTMATTGFGGCLLVSNASTAPAAISCDDDVGGHIPAWTAVDPTTFLKSTIELTPVVHRLCAPSLTSSNAYVYWARNGTAGSIHTAYVFIRGVLLQGC